MTFLNKKLKEFKPYNSNDKRKIDSTEYKELSLILKKIALSAQKTSNITSDFQEELSEIITDVRRMNMSLKKENDDLILSLISYLDIFSSIEKIMNDMKDQKIKESLEICIDLFNENNTKLGINEIPAEIGKEYDNDVHYIADTELTEDENLKNKISKVLKKGYIRGKDIIRKTQIIITK